MPKTATPIPNTNSKSFMAAIEIVCATGYGLNNQPYLAPKRVPN
jgi:hypothetical protein